MRVACRAVVLAFVSSASWGPGAAVAADVEVRATTVFAGRPDVVDGKVATVLPFTELVGLAARHIENPVFADLSVSVDAWASYSFMGKEAGGPLSSDVNVANVEGKLLDRRLRLRLGRQIVQGGAARLLFIDGLGVEFRGPRGLGVSAYAGMPVAMRFANVSRGDLAAGGRVFWAPSFNTELGASIVHVTDRGQLARQDAGLDARARLHRTLTLSATGFWSLAEGRLAELDLGPRWTPTDSLEILADYRRQAPDLLLPRTSILSVFAATQRDDAGLSVLYALNSSLAVYGEGRMLWLPGGQGYDAGARGTWKLDHAGKTTVTAQLRRLQIPDNGYALGRLTGRRTFGELALSLDLESYVLDKPVRGQSLSFSAAANATWCFAPAWQAGVTFFGATTPTFETRYEAIAKLVYTFAHEAPKSE